MKKLVVLAVMASGSILHAERVSFGPFSNGDFSSYSEGFSPSSTGVATELGVSGSERVVTGGSLDGWQGMDGIYTETTFVGKDSVVTEVAAVLDENGSMFQDFNVSTAGIYQLNFETFLEGLGKNESTVGDIGGYMKVTNLETGIELLSKNFTESFNAGRTQIGGEYTLASASTFTALRVEIGRGSGVTQKLFVDNVSVTEIVAVPEPSAAMLVMLGAAGLFRRRR